MTSRTRRGTSVGVLLVLGSVTLAACGSAPDRVSNAASGAATPNTHGPAGTASGGAVATESNPAGDIPDNQVYVPFHPVGGRFSLEVPEGWARSSGNDATTTFTDKYNSITIASAALATAPSIASVTATDLPTLQRTPGFTSPHVSAVRRSAGPAVLVTYQATSAPDPVTDKVAIDAVERYSFWKDGTSVVLTLAAPRGADSVDPWRRVTDSLMWSA